MLASVDGAIGPAEEARIPVTDEGLTRGDGGFEVMRLYAGRPFAYEEHMERLVRTCAGLRLGYDEDAVRAEIAALLDAAGPSDGLLRVIVTRGGRRVLTVEPLPARGPVARVATVTYSPTRVLDGLKTLSYAGNMLAGRIAREQGFDEALFVTPHGRVLEGPTWSFFWVSGGRLLTPPIEDRILASITRAYVIEECEATEQAVHARRPRRRGRGVHRLHGPRGDADRRHRRHHAPRGTGSRDPRGGRADGPPHRARAGEFGLAATHGLPAGLPVHVPEHVADAGKHTLYRAADAVEDRRHV